MRKSHIWIAIVTVALTVAAGLAQQPADTILYNGKVLTVDAKFSIAEAVAVTGGKIAAVGTSADILKMAGPNTVKIDLKGRTMTPGLVDTHVHLESPGAYGNVMDAKKRKTYPLNFRAVKTKDDVLKQIKDTMAAFNFKPGEWVYFTTNPRGDQGKLLFDELNRYELDKAAPNNPIAMTLGVPVENVIMVNSKGIEQLWKKYGQFVETYGRYWADSAGKPTGILEPPAVRIIFEDDEFIPSPAPEDVGPAYKKLIEETYTTLGLTTISGGLHTTTVDAYKWLEARGELPIRYAYGVMATFGLPGRDMKSYKMGAGSDMMWISSMSSRAVDGAGSRMCINVQRDSGSAASATGDGAVLMGLSAASEWWPRGQCSLDIEYNGATRGARIKKNYFAEWFEEVAADGLRSANSHTAGDASHSMLITQLEKIDRAKPGSVKGWAMDHCDLINPADIPRAAKLGMMWSCYPEYAIRSEAVAAFGEKIANSYPVPAKSMLDAGINMSVEGSWLSYEALITRKNDKGVVVGPDQKLTRAQALKAGTQNGANYVLKGDKIGSIEKGKLADLAVLDRDFMTIPEDDISEIKSVLTMLGGKILYLRTDFSDELGLKPAGTLISTPEELRKRRPGGGAGGGGGEGGN